MPATGDLNRADLLKLTPEIYLKEGYRGNDGLPRPELRSVYATAAATQLGEAEASPQELGSLLEAMRQVLPGHTGAPAERLSGVAHEAFELVCSLYEQASNPGIVQWIQPCIAAVRMPEDVDLFFIHFEAVVQQCAVIAGIRSQ